MVEILYKSRFYLLVPLVMQKKRERDQICQGPDFQQRGATFKRLLQVGSNASSSPTYVLLLLLKQTLISASPGPKIAVLLAKWSL